MQRANEIKTQEIVRSVLCWVNKVDSQVEPGNNVDQGASWNLHDGGPLFGEETLLHLSLLG